VCVCGSIQCPHFGCKTIWWLAYNSSGFKETEEGKQKHSYRMVALKNLIKEYTLFVGTVCVCVCGLHVGKYIFLFFILYMAGTSLFCVFIYFFVATGDILKFLSLSARDHFNLKQGRCGVTRRRQDEASLPLPPPPPFPAQMTLASGARSPSSEGHICPLTNSSGVTWSLCSLYWQFLHFIIEVNEPICNLRRGERDECIQNSVTQPISC